MKCYYHPDRDAVATCSVCGKPICEDDIAIREGDKVICTMCAIAYEVEKEAKGKEEAAKKAEELKKAEERKKARAARKRLTIILFVGIILIGAELGFYVSQRKLPKEAVVYEPPPEIANPSPDNPATVLIVYQGLIKYYTAYKTYPADLGELIKERFIPETYKPLIDRGAFVYETDGKSFSIGLAEGDTTKLRSLPESEIIPGK